MIHLGYFALVVLPAKKLLQDLCREKRGWDDPISDGDGEMEESVGQSFHDNSKQMREICLFWRLENCRVAQLCRRFTSCIWSSLVSQIGGCRRKDLLRVSNWEVSPCFSETNDCAKIGTVSCSVSRSVRPDRKRTTGNSD